MLAPIDALVSAAARLALAAAGLCAALATAQTRPVAFPQGSPTGTMGNWLPLGENCLTDPVTGLPSSGGVAESRYQFLLPAEFLPPRACDVWALEHVPVWLFSATVPNCAQGMYTVQYASLEITVAHRARGSGPLSLTFAANLPTPAPLPVFPAQPVTITWTTGSWNPINFATPFAYNGVDDLVVEIQKVVTPTGQNVGTLRNLNPVRSDLPRPVQIGGVQGSGANTAATGSYGNPLGWRLRFDYQLEPTLEARGPLGANNLHFETATTMHFRLFAEDLDLFLLAATVGAGSAAGPGNFLPSPLALPPFQGGIWLLPPVTVLTAGLVALPPGTAYHSHNLPLPPNPALAGLGVSAQAAVLDLTAGQWNMSNAVDFIIR